MIDSIDLQSASESQLNKDSIEVAITWACYQKSKLWLVIFTKK